MPYSWKFSPGKKIYYFRHEQNYITWIFLDQVNVYIEFMATFTTWPKFYPEQKFSAVRYSNVCFRISHKRGQMPRAKGNPILHICGESQFGGEIAEIIPKQQCIWLTSTLNMFCVFRSLTGLSTGWLSMILLVITSRSLHNKWYLYAYWLLWTCMLHRT